MIKRVPKAKQENNESEPSYLKYELFASLGYYISCMKTKQRFLDSFIKDNSHPRNSEAEFIARTQSNLHYLERHIIKNSFSGCDPEKIPEFLRNNTRNHFFGIDIIDNYRTKEFEVEQLMYMNGWKIALDDTIADLLVGYGNLKPIIMKELERGNTKIEVIVTY
jgi:hypothetical protein